MALLSLLPIFQQNINQCPVTSDISPSSSLLPKLGQASTALAMFLASESMTSSNAIIANISVAPSNSWYFSLSPFESILLGLIVLKLMLLRYLTILPIDINSLGNHQYFDFRKRRKRSSLNFNKIENPKIKKEKERLAEIMFTVVRRLDMQDCFLRMLCELQAHSLRGKSLPREVKLTLSSLSKSGWKRKQEPKPDLGPDFIEERPILSVFEEAVQIGWDTKGKNSTECMERYFICPLTTEDIFAHFDTVKTVNVL